jgi:hypothetical protein
MGNDQYHPASISRQVAELLPNASLIERWKEEPHLELASAQFSRFLATHGG